MRLYNLYIPSLHDELGHPRIWIGIPTLTTLSCQRWSNVVPMCHASITKAAMPARVQCSTNVWSTPMPISCQRWPNVVPMLEAQYSNIGFALACQHCQAVMPTMPFHAIPAMYTAPTEFTRKQTYIVSFPVLSMCMYSFRYHYGPFRYLFCPFRCLFGPFRCLFGPFRSFSVPFCPFRCL